MTKDNIEDIIQMSSRGESTGAIAEALSLHPSLVNSFQCHYSIEIIEETLHWEQMVKMGRARSPRHSWPNSYHLVTPPLISITNRLTVYHSHTPST